MIQITKTEKILNEKKFIFWLLAIGGVLTGLTLVFPKIGFIEWISLLPVALVLLKIGREKSAKSLYGYGYFFFFCYYTVIYHWFVKLYPLEFISGMTKSAAIFIVILAWFGLSALQAFGGGFVFLLFGVFSKTEIAEKYPFLKPVFIAAVWSVFEWTQTLFWFGVPWGRLPLGQSEYLVELQTASIFGSYFITFLLVFVNFVAAYTFLCPKKIRICAVVCVATVLMNTVVGSLLYFFNKSVPENTVKVAVIQGNISSSEKWSFSTQDKILNVYHKYTTEAAKDGADIVVWPETALPYTIDDNVELSEYVRKVAKSAGVTVLVGVFVENKESGADMNSIVAVHPDGSFNETVYSKRHLVPFGEYVPLKNLIQLVFPPLAELIMTGEDIEAGKDANVIQLEEGKIGSLICFDSIYEELARDSVLSGAEFITVSTNDSWFSDSAALYMHNSQAQLRAIETNRYVARAANTGVSTFISDRGEILASLEPLTEGYIVYEIEKNTDNTVYTYIGNLFVYLCIFMIVFILGKFIIDNCLKKQLTKSKTNDRI